MTRTPILLGGRRVIAHRTEAVSYPQRAPFHPDACYPEALFADIGGEPNGAYQAVRECFRLAGLDAARYGSPEWNPLGDLIAAGERVLLKPNMVKESHPRDPEGWRYVLTHGSVIRAVADYVWKALRGSGTLILADAPQTDSSFSEMVRLLGLAAVQQFYNSRGLHLEVIDLRREEWESMDGVISRRHQLPGDPRGGVAFDLGSASEFVGHAGAGRYYGADYDSAEVNRHHSGGRHEYLIAGSAIQADVVFSLPKLKTHKKAGITVSLKNLVGVNADKNWLPHHTEGDPRTGGDEHPAPDAIHRAERRIVRYFRRLSLAIPALGPWIHRQARRAGRHVFGDSEEVVRSGNWSGNETIWRMCLDLNKLIFYGNPDGSLRPPDAASRKRHFVLVDGIIAGEGRGPMNPDPVPAGLVVFGTHAPSVDAACAWLMGFDPGAVPIVRHAFMCRSYPLADWGWQEIELASDRPEWNGLLTEIPDDATYHFRPHFGWSGSIERRSAPVVTRTGGDAT
jgi:uncharacterized protein (DUF362 family)